MACRAGAIPGAALQYAELCHDSDAHNRFSPLYQGGVISPAAYAGDTEATALWEVVLRGIRHDGIRRVPQHQVRNRYLVRVRASRSLKLLNLRRPESASLVASGRRPPDLSAAWPSAYRLTRAWARKLYDRLPDVDGFIYDSHQLPSDCIVLVQTPPKDPKVFDRAGKARAVVDEPVRSLLNAEARRVKAVVDFGRLPYSANVACPSCRDSAAPGLLDWQTARRQRQPSALTPTGDSLPDRAVIFVTAEESK